MLLIIYKKSNFFNRRLIEYNIDKVKYTDSSFSHYHSKLSLSISHEHEPFVKITPSQIYPNSNRNSKLNTKLRLEFQVEYGLKLEFQVELLMRREIAYKDRDTVLGICHVFWHFLLCWALHILIHAQMNNDNK